MENKHNEEKEAEALGYSTSDTAYIIPVSSEKSALPMAPPVYYDNPGQKWSWCHVVTSVISLFFCTCCGLIATIVAMASYTDHKARDFARSQKKRRLAYGFAITAIVLGCILLIGCIIMMANSYGKRKSHFMDDVFAYPDHMNPQPFISDQQHHKGGRDDSNNHPDMDPQPMMAEKHGVRQRPGKGDQNSMEDQAGMDHHPNKGQRPGMPQHPPQGKHPDMPQPAGMDEPSDMAGHPSMPHQRAAMGLRAPVPVDKQPDLPQHPPPGQRANMPEPSDLVEPSDMGDRLEMGKHHDMGHHPHRKH